MLYMRNLAGLLHRRAQMAASAPAVGVGNRVHQSFGQLSLRSAQLAETLRSEHGLSAPPAHREQCSATLSSQGEGRYA